MRRPITEIPENKILKYVIKLSSKGEETSVKDHREDTTAIKIYSAEVQLEIQVLKNKWESLKIKGISFMLTQLNHTHKCHIKFCHHWIYMPNYQK